MRPDPRDIVDLSSAPTATRMPTPPPRPFLSLYFGCANVYARAYKRTDGTCYEGRCPKCGKSIDFPVGQGGTSRRMFEVRCD